MYKKYFPLMILLGLLAFSAHATDNLDQEDETLDVSRRVVVSKIHGVGLGNQFFMYSAAYALAQRLDADLLVVHNEPPAERTFDPSERVYLLDLFNIQYHRIMTYQQFERLMEKMSMKDLKIQAINDSNYYDIAKENADLFVCDDYFESNCFFLDSSHKLRELLRCNHPPEENAHLKDILSTESVAVHFRRRDCFSYLDLHYQLRAMENIRRMVNNPHFFLFSDDIKFLESIATDLKDTTIVSSPDLRNIDEFFLMSSCKHIIRVNSTFSWWAAWLNPNPDKIVIGPNPHQKESFYLKPDVAKSRLRKRMYTVYGQPPEWYSLNPYDPNDLIAKKSDYVFNPRYHTPVFLDHHEVISFADNHNHEFLVSGWSYPETWGRWSESETTNLLIQIPTDNPTDLDLVLETQNHFHGSHQRLDINVLVNNAHVTSLCCQPPERSRKVISIPRDIAFSNGGRMNIQFVFQGLKAPFETTGGTNPDRRLLGFGLWSLQVLPTEFFPK